MTVANLYSLINPSLLLDFANVKALDPRITFARASNASYYDNSGVLRSAVDNQARFDHDPVTGQSLGLLIEEQRTNLVLRSEQFDNASWSKTNSSITSNSAVAPNSTLTADKLVEDTATGNHLFFVGGINSTVTTFTASIYAKASERDKLRLQARNELSPSGGVNADFNLTTQTVVIGNFGDGTGVGQIESVGNGWFRCSITVTVVTAGTTLVFALFLANAAGSFSYTGDGTSGILLWGAQLEAGAFPTSYVLTEASQVTRAADAASITGTNFSSWYRADEGSLYAEALGVNNVQDSATRRYIEVSDGANDRMILGYATTAEPGFLVIDDSVIQAYIPIVATVGGTQTKIAAAYRNNDFQQATNNILGSADLSGTVPSVNQLLIGRFSSTSTTFINGTIKKIAYYPQRLTNTQLQALTR